MTTPIDRWEDGVLEAYTPEMARRWIRRSHQRMVDLLKVRRMLDDLEEGRWDPETHRERPVIVSTTKQELADGHHRTYAVLMHGEPIPTYILYRR